MALIHCLFKVDGFKIPWKSLVAHITLI